MNIDRQVELAKARARIERLRPGLLSGGITERKKNPLFHGMADLGDVLIDIGDALIKTFDDRKGQ